MFKYKYKFKYKYRKSYINRDVITILKDFSVLNKFSIKKDNLIVSM